jgi:hypothetical protein
MKKTSKYGRAPPRSRRSRLIDKGYSDAGGSYNTLEKARAAARRLQEKGFLAQAVTLGGTPMSADWGVSYCVMYKQKKQGR